MLKGCGNCKWFDWSNDEHHCSNCQDESEWQKGCIEWKENTKWLDSGGYEIGNSGNYLYFDYGYDFLGLGCRYYYTDCLDYTGVFYFNLG